ncbi:hypothetical protein MAFF211471_34370 [Ralstonia solanacearum]|nr:hypothetical protein MAFF211471_34370 [Ralstonia solanacearum]BCM08923.1 hypothetical protein MAFF241647_32800 [Ralstonia solanacearum]BCN00909.1 hypothetical protein RPSA_34450 [Ralstonia solanacearum]
MGEPHAGSPNVSVNDVQSPDPPGLASRGAAHHAGSGSRAPLRAARRSWMAFWRLFAARLFEVTV